MFTKWISSLIAGKETKPRTNPLLNGEDAGEEVKKIVRGVSQKKIFRMGQLNMEMIRDGQNGKWYLVGGMCIEMGAFDADLELYGISEDGWNGMIDVHIDGNGLIQIRMDPIGEVDDDEVLYKGSIDLAPYNYIPFAYDRTETAKISQNRPRRYNLRDEEEE